MCAVWVRSNTDIEKTVWKLLWMLRIKLRKLKKCLKRGIIKPRNVNDLDDDAKNSIEGILVENTVVVRNRFTNESNDEVFKNRMKKEVATVVFLKNADNDINHDTEKSWLDNDVEAD